MAISPGAILAVLLAAILLASCSTSQEDTFDQPPPEKIYADAREELAAGNNRRAAGLFQRVEQIYPYSPLAVRAQLNAGYAYFADENYPDAVSAAERFIELHPTHEHISYAYYLAAMSHYKQIFDTQRDQNATRKSIDLFKRLIDKFPETSYARDVREPLDIARNNLAGYHIGIGRYYQKNGNFTSAINRFKVVVEQHQNTNYVAEALLRMTECYLALGVIPEAQRAAAVLGHNFVDTTWYDEAYALLEDQGLLPKGSIDPKNPNRGISEKSAKTPGDSASVVAPGTRSVAATEDVAAKERGSVPATNAARPFENSSRTGEGKGQNQADTSEDLIRFVR